MANQCKISAAMVAESEERSYVLEVHEYSRAKNLLKNGEYMASPPFSVAGHNFVLRYFPNGASDGFPFSLVASFRLVLDSAEAEEEDVKARLTVLGTDGQRAPQPYSLLLDHNGLCVGYDIYHWALEGSWRMIMDDCFSIRYDVRVEKDVHHEEIAGDQFVAVPPSDLHLHFGNLLESMVGADVIFHVGGKKFLAHRYVLAARSPVFKVELYGAMKENTSSPIVIGEMEAPVFKCLLHFIYTDSLPALEMAGRDVVMASHLLVAADRYNIERLKLICEHKLCSYIDANMVASTLILAHQHGCHGLKEACLQFLASPSNLEAMKASGGHQHLKSTCPSLLKELLASLLPDTMKVALKDIIMEL